MLEFPDKLLLVSYCIIICYLVTSMHVLYCIAFYVTKDALKFIWVMCIMYYKPHRLQWISLYASVVSIVALWLVHLELQLNIFVLVHLNVV